MKNSKLEFVDTINDVDIVADTGVNPFTTGPSGAKDGTYEIFVTPKGDQGLKNEIQYNTEGKSSTWLILLILVGSG